MQSYRSREIEYADSLNFYLPFFVLVKEDEEGETSVKS
jgi:hypothetical protein